MSSNYSQLQEEICKNAIFRMDESSRMIHIALSNLEEKYIWMRPNNNSNSIGNQILHLCGNISQYAICSLGNIEDFRERELEFTTKEGYTKKELLYKLNSVVNTAKETINNCTTANLIKKREVQGFVFSGIGIILHVVEHYSYHTGQIAFWVKQLKDKPLGFYDGIDLTVKNK